MKGNIVHIRKVTLTSKGGDVSHRYFHPTGELPPEFYDLDDTYDVTPPLSISSDEIISGVVVSDVVVLNGSPCVVVQFEQGEYKQYDTFYVGFLG